jgi:lipoprotein-releasing system ATP-binding protein
MTKKVIELGGVVKDFGTEVRVRVLHGIDLSIEEGEFASLVGPSGSGKSTLLNIVGLLDRPTEGSVSVLGHDTRALVDDELTRLRGNSIGFVFQFHHLINALSSVENVMAPLFIREGHTRSAQRKLAIEALDFVGLADRANDPPSKLSGGQQQRVAIARALVGKPALVLADEPTGNLDTVTSNLVFELLLRLNRELATAFLIVTHDAKIAEKSQRLIEVVDGCIARDEAVAGTLTS